MSDKTDIHTNMKNFILKFGKYKGSYFLNTPKSYQDWLTAQTWFKFPESDAILNAQKKFSDLSRKLKNWNGYSSRGTAIYDQMFEAEMAIEDALYCDCGNRKDENEKFCYSCM